MSAISRWAADNRQHLTALLLLLLLALTALGATIFSTERILSDGTTDVAAQFLYTRAFGFGEMASGNFPLWNPFYYGGVPFLGDFQSALLYVPNAIFLVLPIAAALNWSFALHLFLLGGNMYAWASFRGMRPAAAFVAGAAAMFSGTVFLHIYAGHLTNICAMAWAPLVFLGIDGWLNRRHAGWLLLTAAAAAAQVYAGHPQYTYFTAFVSGLYALARLPQAKRPFAAVLGFLVIPPLAVLLSAAQLLPGLAAGAESVRGGGVDYRFASLFSFAPENLITLGVPWFFGDTDDMAYWGRCNLWEMNLFLGAGVILLAAFGAVTRKSTPWPEIAILVAALVLALGKHTPLHRFLYDYLPLFDSFRGSSKFVFFVGLFAALLAGMGAERFLSGSRPPIALGVTGIGIGVALAAGSWFTLSPEGLKSFRTLFDMIGDTGESLLGKELYYSDLVYARTARDHAGQELARAAGAFAMIGAILLLARKWLKFSYLAIALAVLELWLFARASVSSFSLEKFRYHSIAESLAKTPGDYRIINLFNPDASVMLGKEGIWGYDPSVLKRYAQLLYVTQKFDPDHASQDIVFRHDHAVLDMLRCRFALVPVEEGIDQVTVGDPAPRFFFTNHFEVLKTDEVLDKMRNAKIDLHDNVLLEQAPEPRPGTKLPGGSIKVLNASTDHATLEVFTPSPTLLVETDSYSRDWKVKALPDSVQSKYEILPANYAVRAIPLSAGTHRFTMSYWPSGFTAGIVLTSVTLAGIAGVFLSPLRRRLSFPLP